MIPKAVYILFGASFTLASAYVLGRLLLERLRIRLYREEEWLFGLVCGASLLHLLVFLLCSVQLARKGVFFSVGAAILATGWAKGVFGPSRAPGLPPLGRLWKWLFAAIYLAYAVLYLSNAMAPEMSPDGSSYHLGLVARYLREHGFSRITTNMYANLTQGVEMLYLFAFAFGRHSAAAVVHFGFTMALPLLILTHARRFGLAAAGVGAAVLMLCAPVVGIDGTTAYNDVAVTAVVFSLYCLLEIWREERQSALIVPVGLLAGFCYAGKYTAGLAIPFAAGILLWRLWRARQPWLKPLLVFAACAAVMAVPWAAKNWIIVGNPLSPFFNRYFPNPNVHISFEQEYVERMRHYGDPKSYWDIPMDLTVHGAMLSGTLGPVFVLLPLALLALRRPRGRSLLAAGAFFALPYLNNIGTRFLLPSLPFFSLALAMVFARSRGVLPVVMAAHAILSWPHVLKLYSSQYAWRLERIPVAAALRIQKEEKYLTDFSYGYVVARMIEDFVPKGEKVFTFSGVAEAYTTRDILTAYQAGFNNNLGEFVWAGLFPDSAPTHQLTYTFRERPLRHLKLVQNNSGTDQWSISEWRIYKGEKELPRSPEWRLRAWPNPWDAELAFDNSLVTRWRSWEAIKPGMFFEVDLGGERLMDSVRLEITKDQYQAALKLYGRGERGDWTLLSGAMKESDVPLMKGLRRAAMEELRARGVRYLLVAPDDPAGQDYMANAALWGIGLLAERGGTRLYRINEAAP